MHCLNRFKPWVIKMIKLTYGLKWDMTFWKLLPANLLQVSTLTCDHCFQGQAGSWCYIGSYTSLIIGSRASDCEDNLLKIMATNLMQVSPASSSSGVIILKKCLFPKLNFDKLILCAGWGSCRLRLAVVSFGIVMSWLLYFLNLWRNIFKTLAH